MVNSADTSTANETNSVLACSCNIIFITPMANIAATSTNQRKRP